MSHNVFMALLTSIVLVGFAAVWAYCYGSAVDQPAVRAVLTLGVPRLAAWINPPGVHRAPWGYVPPPTPRRAVTLAPSPVVAIILGTGEVLDSAPLPVRVAEILAHNEDDEHIPLPERTDEGATDTWSPTLEVSRERAVPTLVRSEPDADERALLAAMEALGEDLRKVPDWLTEWGAQTDAYLEAAGLRSEPHKRWRAGILDFPTGELPRVLIGA